MIKKSGKVKKNNETVRINTPLNARFVKLLNKPFGKILRILATFSDRYKPAVLIMRQHFFGLAILMLAACNNQGINPKPASSVPKALKEKGPIEYVSKRYNSDLLEDLYAELTEKTAALKELEDKINDLPKNKADSLHWFNTFNEKNESWFNAANNHAAGIKDSLLRKKIQAMLLTDLASYHSATSPHHDLLKTIDGKRVHLDDLHTVLKITKTYQLMEKYQKENMPSVKPINGFIKQLDEIIKTTDTLSKQ
jgi:hypothetical protein